MVGERGPELLSLPRGASVTPLPTGGNTSLRTSNGDGGISLVVNTLLDGKVIATAVAKVDPESAEPQMTDQIMQGVSDEVNDTALLRFNVVVEELFDRLEGDSSYRDELALTTALGKALEIGFQCGMADVLWEVKKSAELNGWGDKLHIDVTHTPGVDLWALEFGDDDLAEA